MATEHQKAEHERLGNDVTHQRTIHAKIYVLFLEMMSGPLEIPDGKKGLIVFGLATRCLETAVAVRLLVDNNAPMIEDASSLVRILIESIINAAFIAVSDETMARRFDAWGDFFAARQQANALKAFPKSTPEEQKQAEDEIRQLEDQALREFPDFKDQRGSDFWGNNYERAAEVDKVLEGAASGTVKIRDFALLHETWRSLSNYVHQNALAVRKRLTEDATSIGIGRRYTDADKANVLWACNQAMFASCLVLDLVYLQAKNSQRWNDLNREWRPYTYVDP
jgi:hypothetical protein